MGAQPLGPGSRAQAGGGRLSRLPLFLTLAALLALPAEAAELIVSYPGKLAVVNADAPDDWGLVPLSGTVEAACMVPGYGQLLVHMPTRGELAVVDVRPAAPTRYQVLASFRARELFYKGLRFVQSGGTVYLAHGRRAHAVYKPQKLMAKLGLYTYDFLPVVHSSAQHAYLPQGVFTLEKGQLSFENPRTPPGVAPVFEYVRLPHRPTGMLVRSGKLMLSLEASDGSGRLVALDPASRRITREWSLEDPVSSMAWLDDGQLGVLSGDRLALLDTRTGAWVRRWASPVPGHPIAVLPAAPEVVHE